MLVNCSRRRTLGSDLISLQLPMQLAIVVGSVKSAIELLDKRSQIYSDRIHSVVLEL